MHCPSFESATFEQRKRDKLVRLRNAFTKHIAIIVLTAMNLRNVARDAVEDKDVVHGRIFLRVETADENETSTLINCLRHLSQLFA